MIDIELSSKTYRCSESIAIHKTKRAFEGLSNMAAGYPIKITGTHVLMSDPHVLKIQKAIISKAGSMAA